MESSAPLHGLLLGKYSLLIISKLKLTGLSFLLPITIYYIRFRYIFGSVGQDDLVAFYRYADVALVTPLRDGMNLVAKEFVASQDDNDPGVLILSPFAGAGGTQFSVKKTCFFFYHYLQLFVIIKAGRIFHDL